MTAIHKTLDCLRGGPARGRMKLREAGHRARESVGPREEPEGGPLGRRQVVRIAGINDRVSKLSEEVSCLRVATWSGLHTKMVAIRPYLDKLKSGEIV